MRLRSQVEHAVLCCLLMIGLDEGENLSTGSMASLYDMPKEYLAKTLQALSRAGVVKAQHGMSGGYRLSRDPEAIYLLEIVEAIEGGISTFKQTRRIERLLAGGRGDGVVTPLGHPFEVADDLWRKTLAASSLAKLAQHVGLSHRGLSGVRDGMDLA